MSTIKEPSSGGLGMGMSRAAKKRKRLSDCTKRNSSPTPAAAETASRCGQAMVRHPPLCEQIFV